MAFDNYVDMEMDDDDALDAVAKAPMAIAKADTPKYPWGLRICLTNKEMEKLGLDDTVERGATLHFKAFARVTSVSDTQMEDGTDCMRVELQITSMSVPENEDEEDE